MSCQWWRSVDPTYLDDNSFISFKGALGEKVAGDEVVYHGFGVFVVVAANRQGKQISLPANQ